MTELETVQFGIMRDGEFVHTEALSYWDSLLTAAGLLRFAVDLMQFWGEAKRMDVTGSWEFVLYRVDDDGHAEPAQASWPIDDVLERTARMGLLMGVGHQVGRPPVYPEGMKRDLVKLGNNTPHGEVAMSTVSPKMPGTRRQRVVLRRLGGVQPWVSHYRDEGERADGTDATGGHSQGSYHASLLAAVEVYLARCIGLGVLPLGSRLWGPSDSPGPLLGPLGEPPGESRVPGGAEEPEPPGDS